MLIVHGIRDVTGLQQTTRGGLCAAEGLYNSHVVTATLRKG